MLALKVADKISSIIRGSGRGHTIVFAADKAVLGLLSDPAFVDTFRRKSMRLFVDMDGVLTDWKKQYLAFGGQDFISSKDIDWEVTNNFSFWSTMSWMPGGKYFWEGIRHLNPVVLSSPGHSDFAREGKSFWVRENLGDSVPLITDSRKGRYADGRSLLVDDMPKFIDPWEENGGLGVLYKDPASAARDIYKKVKGSS